MKTIGWKGAENTVKNLKWHRMHLKVGELVLRRHGGLMAYDVLTMCCHSPSHSLLISCQPSTVLKNFKINTYHK